MGGGRQRPELSSRRTLVAAEDYGRLRTAAGERIVAGGSLRSGVNMMVSDMKGQNKKCDES